MTMAGEMARLAGEIIASYEARVASVEQILERTHEMLEAYRRQREAIRTQLRETLARAASLRRRDFDVMMQGILARQEAREQAVKETMKGYLRQQLELAAALKKILARGEAERVEAVKVLLEGVMVRQDGERAVRALLAEFRSEQEELARVLRGLLSNGGSMRVKEFKATLRAIQSRRGELGRDDTDQMRVPPAEGRVHPSPCAPGVGGIHE